MRTATFAHRHAGTVTLTRHPLQKMLNRLGHWFISSYLTHLLVRLATSFSYVHRKWKKIIRCCYGEVRVCSQLFCWSDSDGIYIIHVSWLKLYATEFIKCVIVVSVYREYSSFHSFTISRPQITTQHQDYNHVRRLLVGPDITCGGGNVTGVISDSGGVMHSVRHLPGIITLLQHRPCTISKPPTIILLRPGLSWNNRHCLGLESGYVSK